jgi:hypothetical protein
MRMFIIVISTYIFLRYLINGMVFEKKVIEYKSFVFIFSKT